ncbi:MAG: twin-arginine translocase subunit TatC [Bacteriovoracaceae bacterium]|jgi:sec-independent protein translocase protein TatC|nr:twin-arginine translocase subunit TatC [Halobacteriovoraceae bacterium]MDP7321589.1 twin-arginine translocase subunit TatC [Bacteriovoracaceae bacterium]
MALTDHLEELRNRLIRIIVILFVAFFVCYHFGAEVQNFLLAPLREALGTEGKIVFLGLLDKVLTQFQLAFWSAIIVSSPFWFGQIWLFIKPGLYEKEIKIIRPFLFFGFVLFWLGIAFGYFIVFPFTFGTILNFGVQGIEATMSLKDYIILSSKILVFLGVLFQLPNVLLILGFMGIVTSKKLSELRRYVITGFAVISAIMTPPDPVTMMALWVPMVCLYELGLWSVFLIVDPYMKKKNKDIVSSDES